MINFSKQAKRLLKTVGAYTLATVMGALAVGLTVEPALADRNDQQRRQQQWRHEQQQNERQWRNNQRRHRKYVVPPGHLYYAPPPPVYYYPQPLAPSFSIIFPLRIN